MDQAKAFSLITEYDIYLFKSGKHFNLYEKLGSHPATVDGVEGCYFAVYAPAADSVEVIGDFNHWQASSAYQLFVRWDSSGIWEGFIPNVTTGGLYKYKISSSEGVFEKADPFAFYTEIPPKTASKIWDSTYKWKDEDWMEKRKKFNRLEAPYSVYEVHLGSWRKNILEDNRSLTYTEFADELVDYVKDMGFTHVELLPIMQHPYEPSWGYQTTGYFAPMSKFGSPEDFKHLVDKFHENEIGVILDWVPAHFPSDEFALAKFDGTHVYEHPDVKKGYHPDWKSLIFNFERNEIRSFLISSAMYWMKEYHADGLRVDAVASMIYLDYSRNEGEWDPNENGGNENLAAISFLKDFNTAIYRDNPGIHTMAEESTSFTGVSKPVDSGGLGFGMKWMMGWMNDTLDYFQRDPIHRKYHQNNITFSLAYAFSENFMLPLSHDEVVHGKMSLLNKMPGDEWQKFANLRTLYGYMFTHPGTKLLFMGNEIGQGEEWDSTTSIQWHLLDFPLHKGIQSLVRDCNEMYKTEEALTLYQFEQRGFEWIDYSDHQNSIIVYLRKTDNLDESLLVICNFSPTSWPKYRVGVPQKGKWKVVLNTDDEKYCGSGFVKEKYFDAQRSMSHGRVFSIEAEVPPLGVLVLKLY